MSTLAENLIGLGISPHLASILAPVIGNNLLGTLWRNPVASFNASGSNATTTGSIASSSNFLLTNSTAGWSPQMGIAVSGAGAGGVELVTTVTNVQGGIGLGLAAAASTSVIGATVNHDDTVALSSAISASLSDGLPIWLPNGNYNITGSLTALSSPVSIRGQDIFSTAIINRGAAVNLFTINYNTLSPFTTIKKSCVIENFQISQDPNVSATSGGMFTIGASSGLVTGVRLRDIVFNGIWEGLHVNAGQISNWFERLYFRNLSGGNALVYNSPPPNGDCHFSQIECTGYNTGILIQQSDTMEFSNLKTNFTGVKFAAPNSNADIVRVRFINPSIEGDFGSNPSAGFDFGTHGTTQVSIIGGGVGGMPAAFNNLHLNSGGYVLTNTYNTSDSFSGWVQYGTITTIAG